MKQYENYIFDLYGTLIDMWTDEGMPALWRHMAELYAVYGADWKPKDLAEAYRRMDREEREKLSKKNGSKFPEIDLTIVFERMLTEAPKHHDSFHEIGDREDFLFHVANSFRVRSRKRFKTYKNTLKTLEELRNRGKGVYLLSNAQKVFTMPEIEVLGLNKFFDAMYISSDYGIMKPDPKFMEILLKGEKLDKKTCVMVGNDLDSDMGIAAKAGVDGILLNTYPYSEKTIKEHPLGKCPVISDIKELLEE